MEWFYTFRYRYRYLLIEMLPSTTHWGFGPQVCSNLLANWEQSYMAALPLIHMTEKNLVVSVTKIWSSSFDSHNIAVKVQKFELPVTFTSYIFVSWPQGLAAIQPTTLCYCFELRCFHSKLLVMIIIFRMVLNSQSALITIYDYAIRYLLRPIIE